MTSQTVNNRRPLHFAGLLLAMTFPLFMAWVYFVKLAPSSDDNSRPSALSPAMIAYSAGKTLQFSLPVLMMLAFSRSRLRFHRPSTNGLLMGLFFGMAAGIFILVIYFVRLRSGPLLEGVAERVQEKVRSFHMETPALYALMSLFLCAAHSLLEEYYWRWFVFIELKQWMATWWAIVLSSTAFTFHHIIVLWVYFPDRLWSAALPYSFCVGLGGAVWAWIYHRSGSILGPWLSHILIDAAIITVGYDMMFVRLAQ